MSFDLNRHLSEQAEALASDGFNVAQFLAGFTHANDNQPSNS